MNETSSRRIAPVGLIVAVLGMLAGFAPLATDMYLSSNGGTLRRRRASFF